MTDAEKEKSVNARWEEIKKALEEQMPALLCKKVDGIVDDLRDIEITIYRARSDSRRCRKPAS